MAQEARARRETEAYHALCMRGEADEEERGEWNERDSLEKKFYQF